MPEEKFEQTKEVIKYALKFIKGRTLDLGAGQAKYKPLIEQAADEYVTFDLVPGKNIEVVGEITATGFPNESFDTIICTQVFEHIPVPWQAVKEIGRLLKSGGIVILTAPFLCPYHADPCDYFRYTPEGLTSLLKNEGFEIVEADSYGRMFLTLAEFFRLSFFSPYKKKRWGSNRLMNLINRWARFLNQFSQNQSIYAASYVVARKK